MSSADLPERPHLDQLRRQAKDLKRAALAGDPAALARLGGYLSPGVPVTLAVAQLAVAREYGFASWARLITEVQTRAAEVAERVSEFLHRSVVGSPGAMRLLAADPATATYDIRTAAVLGEVATARRLIAADPVVAVRPDERSGWPPLLYACMSRWHLLVVPDPDVPPQEMVDRVRERAAGGPDAVTALHAACRSGSVDVVRVLLRAGADLEARDRRRNASPLGWAVVGSARRLGHNPDPDWAATVQTLLDAGADPAHAWTGGEFPSKDVAKLLIQRGIDIPGKDPTAMRHALGLDPDESAEPTS